MDGIKRVYSKISSNKEWIIRMDGVFYNNIKKSFLQDGISEEGIQNITINTVKVLNNCPNPSDERECKKTGILIGKIQSGKTSNFLSLIAAAFDNNYNLVVVLGGTKKLLVEQNSSRIKQYLEDFSENIVVLNSSTHKELLCESEISKFLQQNKKVLIVLLKKGDNIGKLTSEAFTDSTLCDQPVLIIDDEGDEASLNNLVNKGKKSPTFKKIEQLKNSLPRHAFISVTATPQANVLINTVDVLSPDFGILIDPGKGYCGLSTFHEIGSKHIIEIPNDEKSLIEKGMPQSFLDSMLLYFVACGIRQYRGMRKNEKVSMLIHPSSEKIDHEAVRSKVENQLKHWRTCIQNVNDISYDELRKMLFNAYLKYFNDGIMLPNFNFIEVYIQDAIRFSKTHIINSDKVDGNFDELYDYNIYIGGNMLGRGLTLSGLIMTYIIRNAKGKSNVDTLEQRARWFGYRESYIDLCRIFLTKKIKEQFQHIMIHEDDLWQTISQSQLQGSNFKDIPRVFALSNELNMTRKTVAKTDRYLFNTWNRQRVFEEDNDILRKNEICISNYKSKHVGKLKQFQPSKGMQAHVVLYDMDFSEVLDNLLRDFLYPYASNFNFDIINKLYLLLLKKELNVKVDIIWIRDGFTGCHPVENRLLKNYMVGRSEYYRGDMYMMDDRNTLQLQIHKIRKKDTDIVNYVMALYIPPYYLDKLTGLIKSVNE